MDRKPCVSPVTVGSIKGIRDKDTKLFSDEFKEISNKVELGSIKIPKIQMSVCMQTKKIVHLVGKTSLWFRGFIKSPKTPKD